MTSTISGSRLIKSGFTACALLLASGASFAEQVNLTAAPATATLPDGSAVPMWGYSCGSPVSATATCAALSPLAATPGAWSPVVITVSTGQDLTINLTNGLPVPTSLVMVGQLGGGLGSTATYVPSPAHAVQGATWPIAGDSNGSTFQPPAQGPRVQSFATEIAVTAPPTTTSLTWKAPRPGT
ncbi:MAG TPA: hypothetical protein VJX66_21155, partial [Amycolatopsis sp.]|nr:hypothetical protein [Amycolatopsis sp.]